MADHLIVNRASIVPLDDVEGGQLGADVCIIGSGPSGQAVARALVGSGLDVLLLEAGDLEPTRWGRRFSASATPSVGRQYPNAGHHVMIRLGGTADRWGVHLEPRLPAGSGTGIRLRRLDEVDLGARPHLGVEGWPVSLEELEPGYQSAEQLFGLGPEPCWRAEAVVGDGSVDTELFLAVGSKPFLTPEIGGIRIVHRCPIRSLVANQEGRITKAIAISRAGTEVDVVADTFVLAMGTVQTARLLLDSPWSEALSIANSSGLVGRYLADHPQLILGQLALHQRADLDILQPLAPSVDSGPSGPILRWPNLVTSPHRASRDRLTRLAATLIPVDRIPRFQAAMNRLPRSLGGRTGAVSALVELRDAVEQRRVQPAALRRLPSLIGGLDEILAAGLGPLINRRSWRVEDPHWAHRPDDEGPAGFQIFAVAEQLPNPDNRIVLSLERNQIGARRPRIEWHWSSDDARLAEKAAEDIRHALAELGVGTVLPRRGRASILKITSHHAAGSTRMSALPADGVVDPNLRTHDHPNLYIVGSSVFRATGFGHPTLTDVALGLRLGDHLLDRLGALSSSQSGGTCGH